MCNALWGALFWQSLLCPGLVVWVSLWVLMSPLCAPSVLSILAKLHDVLSKSGALSLACTFRPNTVWRRVCKTDKQRFGLLLSTASPLLLFIFILGKKNNLFLLLHLFLPLILLSFCFSCLFYEPIFSLLFLRVPVRNKDNFCSSGLSFYWGMCREGESWTSLSKNELVFSWNILEWNGSRSGSDP